MDPEALAASITKAPPRKVRFAPKAPPKREQKTVLPKEEKLENDLDDAKAEQLLRRLKETSVSGKPKVERKVAPAQVAFGFGGSSSLRSYGAPKNINRSQGSSADGDAIEEEYKEPWDYYTYYPTTLPLRRPYSGDPELLDKEEFDEDPQNLAYDESTLNSASDLGLLDDENPENGVFFVQLPTMMPTIKQSTDENPVKGVGKSDKPTKLEDVPAGFMGKMLVYRNGDVKLKLGDLLYDVSPGVETVFGQDVFAVSTEEKLGCNMGEISKRMVITPDVDSMLDSILDQ